jgi:hypothetical protein
MLAKLMLATSGHFDASLVSPGGEPAFDLKVSPWSSPRWPTRLR